VSKKTSKKSASDKNGDEKFEMESSENDNSTEKPGKQKAAVEKSSQGKAAKIAKADSAKKNAGNKKGAAKKTAAKKADSKKPDSDKADSDKTDSDKTDSDKTDSDKTETKKAATKKTASKKTAVKKSATTKTAAKKTESEKTVSKKSASKNDDSKDGSTQKSASKKSASKDVANKDAADKDASSKDASKKTAAAKDKKKADTSNQSKALGKAVFSKIHEFVKPYKVTSGKNFKLSDYDPEDTGPFASRDKDDAKLLLEQGIQILEQKQDMLYAQDRYSMLLVFQAMDAAGKDSTIKHVMSGINPQGCQVYSFKQPSAEELDHDFMWRYSRCLPERGRIGIYNRSYYEEVLVVRVHEEILSMQRLPDEFVTRAIWSQRLKDIAFFEDYLHRQGVVVLKFFLNVSKREQKKRFLDRLDRADKHWKFSSADLGERKFWNDYQHAYQEAIRHTATEDSPWYVIPADNKWYMRLVVAAAIADTMNRMNLTYPPVDKVKMKEIETAKITLEKSDKA